MTSQIIPLPFVLLYLESVERKGKKYKSKYLESQKSFFDEINTFQFLKGYHLVEKQKSDKK